jgi:flavin-dependent dehydrogenase
MNAPSCRERSCGECDVAVIGGGPAGAAAALTLARAGRAVAVIEQSQYDRLRIGETLPPSARPLIARLGLWARFSSAGHLPSPCVLSVWGDDELYESHSILNPHGTGWHLDRQRFDRMLVDAAQQAGARTHRGVRIHSCGPSNDGGWQLAFADDRDASVPVRRLRAARIIDATGRAATFARQQHARRINDDRLIGLVVVGAARSHDSGPGDDPCGGCTLVEACVDGWWYSAVLPDGRLIAVYMTDADLVPRPRGSWRAFWHARLQQTVHTSARLRGRTLHAAPRLTAANTSRLDRVGGPQWVAAGDALAAWDPLSSQGLVNALSTGLHAGEAVDRQLAGDRGAIDAYAREIDRVLREYSRLRSVYYGREGRWRQSPFWRRRHAIAA